jgi:Na+/phosphate symporter
MTEDTAAAKLAPAISRTAALLAAGAATLVVLLAALHFIEGELDPSWHFISEYAIGDYGWIMVLAFLSLASSYVSLFLALRSQLQTIAGRIGLAMLLVSALGLTLAAIFTTDPITVSANAVTTEGTLHNLGGTLGIAMPFAAALVGWNLALNPAWSSAKQPLLWATGLALVAFVVSFVSLGIMVSQNDGKFGPQVLVGWPNRIEMIAYSVWLMVVAWQAIRVREHNS